jgi:hypothetical protein
MCGFLLLLYLVLLFNPDGYELLHLLVYESVIYFGFLFDVGSVLVTVSSTLGGTILFINESFKYKMECCLMECERYE